MREVITIRGRWTEETLGASLLSQHQADKKISTWHIAIASTPIITSLGIIAWSAFGPNTSDGSHIGSSIFAVGTLGVFTVATWNFWSTLFCPSQTFKRQARKILAEPMASDETTFVFTDEFSAQIDALSEVRLKWKVFSKHQLLDCGLVLFVDGARNITIPRAWTPDESTWQALLTLVAEKVPTLPSK